MEITKKEFKEQIDKSFDVGFKSGMIMAKKKIDEELKKQGLKISPKN